MLSVLCFALVFNDVVSAIPPGIQYSLYVIDFAPSSVFFFHVLLGKSYRSRNSKELENPFFEIFTIYMLLG